MIELLNLKPGEIINHSIVYIFGFCKFHNKHMIDVTDSNQVTKTWNLRNDYFKVKIE
jgi:hypothetical protein